VDKTALVDRDLREGRRLIKALDEARFPVDAALWHYLSEAQRWRFIIASSIYDNKGPREAYTLVQGTLGKLPRTFGMSLQDISVVSPQHNLIQHLRKMISTGSGIEGIRLTRSTINGMFIEDAYIYRVRGLDAVST
jgi:hypothetical protein